jgi:hypothetical protein
MPEVKRTLPPDIYDRLRTMANAQNKTVSDVIIDELREVERLRRELPDLKAIAERMDRIINRLETAVEGPTDAAAVDGVQQPAE